MNLHEALPTNTKLAFMEFMHLHMKTLLMMGGVLLTIPIAESIPVVVGVMGILTTVVGGVAQVVKILHDRAKERDRRRLFEAMMAAGDLEGAKGLVD